jgi:hypothetical protein
MTAADPRDPKSISNIRKCTWFLFDGRHIAFAKRGPKIEEEP